MELADRALAMLYRCETSELRARSKADFLFGPSVGSWSTYIVLKRVVLILHHPMLPQVALLVGLALS
jgi:hypothetical protein